MSLIMKALTAQDDKELQQCIPVSYTHLDVYKRQLVSCGGQKEIKMGRYAYDAQFLKDHGIEYTELVLSLIHILCTNVLSFTFNTINQYMVRIYIRI